MAAWGYMNDTGLRGAIIRLVGHPHPVGRLRAKTVLKFIKNRKTLDVGCGECIYLTELMKRGIECYGIDVDEDALKNCKRNQKKLGIKAKVLKGSAEKIPFPASSAEQVICLDVLEHVDDFDAAINEITRVIKKGGHLVVSMPNRLYLKDTIMPHDFTDHLKEIGHVRYGYDHRGLTKILEKKGFKVNGYEYFYKFFSRVVIELLYMMMGPKGIRKGRRRMYKHGIKSLLMFLVIYPFMNLDYLLPKRKGGFIVLSATKK